ncbi:MAG TPA: TRAP transporter large permease subunit, partial [Bordetella sp.]|nr:TRAP transporter large permease subunit [Bordetella sp.]
GLTPPVAILLFITASIEKIPFSQGVRAIWPFLAVMLLAMFLVMLVPGIATLVPSKVLGAP